MARLRPPWAVDHPLAASHHLDPRGAYNRLASAHLRLRDRLPAVPIRGRRRGDGRCDVLVHVALQPHRRQRAPDACVPCCSRNYPDRGVLVRERGRGAGLFGLWRSGQRGSNRVGGLRLESLAWARGRRDNDTSGDGAQRSGTGSACLERQGFREARCGRSQATKHMAPLSLRSLPPFYSPECVEEEFCELRHNGVLRSSGLPWGSDVFCAPAHIHSPKPGVCCLRYVASRMTPREGAGQLPALLPDEG